MTLSYAWEVTGIKVKNEGDHVDAVVQTFWKKTGTDENGNEGTFSGATPFSASEVSKEDFVALQDLTEDTVLGWIKNVVVDGYEEHVNSQIQEQIDNQITPITEPALPWRTEE